MTILLAIDVGQKRVGLALSDPDQTIASPFKTIERSQDKALQQILEVIKENNIDTLIAGLPLNEKGDKTEQCEDVERFCRRLSRRAKIKIIFVDEHLTSEEAKERLLQGGCAHHMIKDKIDAMAAAVILEDYFKQRNLSKTNNP